MLESSVVSNSLEISGPKHGFRVAFGACYLWQSLSSSCCNLWHFFCPMKTQQPWKFPRYQAKVTRKVRNWSSKLCEEFIPLSIPMVKLSAHFTFSSRAFGQWAFQPLSPKFWLYTKVAILTGNMMMAIPSLLGLFHAVPLKIPGHIRCAPPIDQGHWGSD